MIAKVRAALGKVRDALIRDETQLRRARKRRKKFGDRAEKQHNKGVHASKTADRLRSEGHYEEAVQKDRKADRCHARAFRSSQKSRFWIGRIKILVQRIHKLETREEDLQRELKKLTQGNIKINVEKNEVQGGTPRERIKAAALLSASRCTSGKRPNFYSQPGSWTVEPCFTGERSGQRSDCSQWFTTVYHACGLPDPNGADYTGGYTGTLISNGHRISVSELQPGDAIVYGSGTGFHVEMYVGPGNKTIGHGTAPIDPGVIDLFGDGNYRCYRYDFDRN